MYIPTLGDDEKRVLRAIQNDGVVQGWQLLSEASIDAAKLVQASGRLMSLGIITVSGYTQNPDQIGNAYFNLLPSSANYAALMTDAS
jgi:hypothetical protein